jgi:hypothetical protein
MKTAFLVIAAGTTSAMGQVGACCFPSGVCQLVGSAAACSSVGGVFRGPNTFCGNCPQLPNRWGEQNDAGSSRSNAQITRGVFSLNSITGSMNSDTDSDMYVIQICDSDSFSAETVTGPGTLSDTQLFLFSPDGRGVVFNDDVPGGSSHRSRISHLYVAGYDPGPFYLAISPYDVDPVDPNNNEIWLDQPYTSERPPDGPGAVNPILTWTGNGSGFGATYTITLTGTCFAAPPGWAEELDAGSQIATAQSPLGTGSLNSIVGSIYHGLDSDIFKIRLCNPAGFAAETVTGPGSLFDTQLFLFHPSGVGIVLSDNDAHVAGTRRSRITSAYTSGLAPGLYFLAISGYDNDPASSTGQALWLDAPSYIERGPDGPGAALAMATWGGNAAEAAGTYVIRLSGACYSTDCYANCDGSTVAPILNANDFVCFLTRYAAGCS